jgi:hypothetical protein
MAAAQDIQNCSTFPCSKLILVGLMPRCVSPIYIFTFWKRLDINPYYECHKKLINHNSEYILISDNDADIMKSRRKKFLPTGPNLL